MEADPLPSLALERDRDDADRDRDALRENLKVAPCFNFRCSKNMKTHSASEASF